MEPGSPSSRGGLPAPSGFVEPAPDAMPASGPEPVLVSGPGADPPTFPIPGNPFSCVPPPTPGLCPPDDSAIPGPTPTTGGDGLSLWPDPDGASATEPGPGFATGGEDDGGVASALGADS
ncbi:Uncharacterised protein [Bordetella pertussis]|nr:Uncharacterised protein [Bordetella pertussis]